MQILNLKKNCDYNTTTTLYFYKINNCDECVAQGFVLDSLKRTYQSGIMIFAIDKDTDLGIVNTLKTSYNTTTFPFLVINENVTLSGFRDEKNLRTYIQN